MRHFIYQDEKSHKFWAVEQQGNELHISWGKVGTNGQNQIKSFADAAAAEKAELKLIAEKVKKGYVEQAKDNSLQPSQTVTDSLKVADLSTIIQEQPSFVAETRAADKNTDAVLPWLAKDIAVVFPPEVVHTTLSHRRFPGVPVQQADKLTQLRRLALMNPLMILVKIIKLRWIHILSYDQMVSRKINNQTTRCANSIF
ncbi:WGR domain-containing protein, partial [Escherichia coli]|uniref:WGR domain-containing protein n=2 Tax=Escherichia coli TaxID=562 RepID=UPI003C2E92BD